MRMKIGIGSISGQRLSHQSATQTELVHDSLRLAQSAEAAGLDSIWVTEHHFLPTGHVGSVFPFAAAIGAVTSQIGIGVYALAPRYEPVQLAEDAAFIDLLTGGRFLLGLILGYRDDEYTGFGVARQDRVGRTEELIRVTRSAWADSPMDHVGVHFTRTGVSVYPKPPPGRIPILIGGHHLNAFDRAARLGDGFIMDAGTDSDVFAKQGHNRDLYARVTTAVELYREALKRNGRSYDEGRFFMTIGGFLAAGGAQEAWNLVAEAYMDTRRTYGEWYGLDPEVYRAWYPNLMSEDEIVRRKGELLLGSPDEVMPVLQRVGQIVGDSLHVIFRCNYPGMATDATIDSIRLAGVLRDQLARSSVQ